jgi:hypothetical protein
MKSVDEAGLRTRYRAACGRPIKAQAGKPLLPEELLPGEAGWEDRFPIIHNRYQSVGLFSRN